MARSLAFWLKGVDGEAVDTSVELHFNLWNLKSKALSPFKNDINYLDIGVRINCGADIAQDGSINFYLPFDKKHFSFDDTLGEKIATSDALISAVFNAELDTRKASEQNSYHDLNFSDEAEGAIRFFTHIKPENSHIADTVTINSESSGDLEGSVITFPNSLFTHDPNKNIDSYFRFRIILLDNALKNIMTVHTPSFRAVTNNHEVSEIVDFRVNEIRNLPKRIKKLAGKNTDNRIKVLHYFLIRESRVEFKFSHRDYRRTRVLEPELWAKYLGLDDEKQLKEPMLIYHWDSRAKEKSLYIDHFAAFSKFASRSIQLYQIILVLLVTIFIGIFSGLTTNFTWRLFENNVKYDDMRDLSPTSTRRNASGNSVPSQGGSDDEDGNKDE